MSFVCMFVQRAHLIVCETQIDEGKCKQTKNQIQIKLTFVKQIVFRLLFFFFFYLLLLHICYVSILSFTVVSCEHKFNALRLHCESAVVLSRL